MSDSVHGYSQTFEFEAVLIVLERRALVTQGEILEEIKRLQEKAAKVWEASP